VEIFEKELNVKLNYLNFILKNIILNLYNYLLRLLVIQIKICFFVILKFFLKKFYTFLFFF